MQQKIVMKVPMKKEKDRNKAMKIAVGITGVSSVKICGEDRSLVVVIGDGIDIYGLSKLLKKKFGGATMVRVEPYLIGARLEEFENNIEDQNNQALILQAQRTPSYYNSQAPMVQWQQPSYYNHPSPYYYSYKSPQPIYDSSPYSYNISPVYDSSPPSCSIM